MQAGLDLSSRRGSGPQGRILKKDVLAALGAGPGSRARCRVPWPRRAKSPSGAAPYDQVPHPGMRQVIAQRLGESNG